MMYFPVLEQLKQHPIYHKPDTNELILPIPKTGASTLNHWYREGGWEQRILSHMPKWEGRGLDGGKRYEVCVFLREPEDRFWAGMINAFPYLDKAADPEPTVYALRTFLFIDKHLFPQCFYLMLLYDYCPDCCLTFHSYKSVSSVLNTGVHSNKTDSGHRQRTEKVVRDHLGVVIDQQIKKAYYPDQILWDEFVGKRVHFEDLQERFSRENSFFEQFSIGRRF